MTHMKSGMKSGVVRLSKCCGKQFSYRLLYLRATKQTKTHQIYKNKILYGKYIKETQGFYVVHANLGYVHEEMVSILHLFINGGLRVFLSHTPSSHIHGINNSPRFIVSTQTTY
jgi:hypothetical protein